MTGTCSIEVYHCRYKAQNTVTTGPRLYNRVIENMLGADYYYASIPPLPIIILNLRKINRVKFNLGTAAGEREVGEEVLPKELSLVSKDRDARECARHT